MRDTADLLTLPLRRTLALLQQLGSDVDGFGTRRRAQSKVTGGKKLKAKVNKLFSILKFFDDNSSFHKRNERKSYFDIQKV